MLDTPKPILGTNDDVKSTNADISSLVTTTFDLIENTIKNIVLKHCITAFYKIFSYHLII